MTSVTRSQIEEVLRAHRADILRFSSDLVAIPSENPPGTHYLPCVQRISQELDELGLSYTAVPAPGGAGEPRINLLSPVGSGERIVYFHGHYDVVPAHSQEQFEPRLEDGFLHGSGATDMKAGLAAMIYAAYSLKRLGTALDGRVGLCVVADEETGGRGGSAYLNEIGSLGQGGMAMLIMEPTSGVVWNANRGAVSMKITVKGRAAHVGLQHQSANAFEHMLDMAAALRQLKAEVERRITGYRVHPPEAAYSILMLGGRVEGGANFNVVPESCSFTIDRRFNPEEDLETEKARLFAVLEACQRKGIEYEVEVLEEAHASASAEDHPVAQVLAEAVESVTGARPRFEMCPGVLETRWYVRRGIPAFAYGPGLIECAHGPDERVEMERVYESAVIYALVAGRLLETRASVAD